MTIVCGIDFSPTSQRVVDTAIELALRTKVPLQLVHALESSAPIFDEAIAQRRRRTGDARAHPALERTAVAIAQAAERLDADLICLGTQGHTGLRRALLGSVSSAVLSATRRPVLVAHAPRA